ncbi:GAF domain-containing sensor histidine kinase [Xanthomonas sp. AmX2]|uniref:GAF domain-containing sensor histidine kinase n=1 Tax=Xanthomonas sp. TaxID=29446 RepID=UPI00197DD4EB|nr:GAF domain-containing sensor histidine kinase [Xanthomonas sp.]MBN6151186.1 GAF domain-containing sensor histidine kinase [Xanthomonas sp.]
MPTRARPVVPDPDLERDIAAIGRIAAVPTILQVVSRTTGMRFSAVARVTETTWTACAVYDQIAFGLAPGGQLQLESTICNEIRQSGNAVIFASASTDPVFSQHHTPKLYGFESYVSVPIRRPDGSFFGTLCALDPLPAKIDDDTLAMLDLFAQLIGAHLEAEDRVLQRDTALADAEATAQLREEFIAVLGHDLRNPLQSIMSGIELLDGAAQGAREGKVLDYMRKSALRMSELIDNILDFARGRLGGGLSVAKVEERELSRYLEQVVSEIRAGYADRELQTHWRLQLPVHCDPDRVSQLLGNLVANAVLHGDPAVPVTITAVSDARGFELSVHNGGHIPQSKQAQLFRPFARAQLDRNEPGLGLGLYIVAEISRAHGGTVSVQSTPETGTRFVFNLPATA